MKKAKSPVEQTDTSMPPAGSIADVSARLALWGRRAPKGLARVEFVSEFSRQNVVSQLHRRLPQDKPLHEIELPFQQPALAIVHFLRERLRELPPSVVSVTGFATAFSEDIPPTDALRVLNFHREDLAQFSMCQIWWMIAPFAENFLRSVPDLDSWFMLRLKLSDVIVDKSVEAQSLQGIKSALADPEEARKQSAAYILRLKKALAADASTNEIIHLAVVATSLLGNALLEQEEQEVAEAVLNKMASRLRKQSLLDNNRIAFMPNYMPTRFESRFESENLRMLGQLCECSGRLADAEKFYKAALFTAEFAGWLSFSAPELVSQALIQFYIRHNRFAEAELFCRRWVEIEEILRGSDGNYMLPALNQLFETLLLGEKYMDAEKIYYTMLNIANRDDIQDRVLASSLLTNMAWFYRRLGRYAEAEALSRRASRIPNAA